VTADAGYAYRKVYGDLEQRGIDPVIPAKAEPIRSAVPLRRFRYDAKARHSALPARQDLKARAPQLNTAVSSTPRLATARAARWPRSAYPRVAAIWPWWSVMITRHCCALGDAVFAGQSRSDGSIGGTAGVPKAFTARPRVGMASLEPCPRAVEYAHPVVPDRGRHQP
jgi:hypothetical protein